MIGTSGGSRTIINQSGTQNYLITNSLNKNKVL